LKKENENNRFVSRCFVEYYVMTYMIDNLMPYSLFSRKIKRRNKLASWKLESGEDPLKCIAAEIDPSVAETGPVEGL
jgi:hypothetical protein